MNARPSSIALAVLAPFLIAADKPTLVPDISARQVQIKYSFSGAQLLLFGAIAYPGGRTPSRPAAIAVVLRGPVQPILLREKQKIAGIWMNADSSRFRSAPSFYAVASSRPIRELVDDRTASIYELGIHNLQLSPGGGSLPERERHFEAGLLDLRSRAGLYSEYPRGVEISDGILYRAVVTIPSQVPVGTYTAETFLIEPAADPEHSGKVVAVATRDIQIDKSGFERDVWLASRRHRFVYGLASVALSLGLGWAAAVAFRRRA
ncbi:MAG TPA: TIGR02186 family protein [Sphingomicrobium sp.]